MAFPYTIWYMPLFPLPVCPHTLTVVPAGKIPSAAEVLSACCVTVFSSPTTAAIVTGVTFFPDAACAVIDIDNPRQRHNARQQIRAIAPPKTVFLIFTRFSIVIPYISF